MKPTTICCPKCGYEYLPAEIFYPEDILGHPSNIIRNEEGKIEFFEGTNIELKEIFTCYQCDSEFMVSASFNFNVKNITKTINFDEDYTTNLN